MNAVVHQMQQQAARAPIVQCTDVMIDLETLATCADAVIVSIGAVKFDRYNHIDDKALYTAVAIGSQPGRRMTTDTVAWWMQQSDEARSVFFDPDKHTLEEALAELCGWMDDPKYHVWSNGADFDIPIVIHAMEQLGIVPTWKFYNHRCFRTLKTLFPNVAKPPFEGVKHNALADAAQQAKWAQAIFAEMRNPAPLRGFSAKR